jgi:hypothetical protein
VGLQASRGAGHTHAYWNHQSSSGHKCQPQRRHDRQQQYGGSSVKDRGQAAWNVHPCPTTLLRCSLMRDATMGTGCQRDSDDAQWHQHALWRGPWWACVYTVLLGGVPPFNSSQHRGTAAAEVNWCSTIHSSYTQPRLLQPRILSTAQQSSKAQEVALLGRALWELRTLRHGHVCVCVVDSTAPVRCPPLDNVLHWLCCSPVVLMPVLSHACFVKSAYHDASIHPRLLCHIRP